MPREYKAFLNDISDAINKIEQYTDNLSFEHFSENNLVQDGVVRNLEIIGEATKQLPENVKNSADEIEWNRFRSCLGYC